MSPPSRVMKARKRSTCHLCSGPLLPGQRIIRTQLAEFGRVTWPHVACWLTDVRHLRRVETLRPL